MTHIVPRPLRADARRNRERVIEAARAVFGEQGREAQMDDVARHAQVGVGTVYRHFPTKEALIVALALDSFERVVAKAREALATIEDPWEAFTSTLWSAAEIITGDRALSELMWEIPGPITAGTTVEAEINATMTELLERAKAAGAIRPDVVLDDIPMLMCGLGAGTWKQHRYPDSWRRHLTIIIDGLRAAGASGPLPSS